MISVTVITISSSGEACEDAVNRFQRIEKYLKEVQKFCMDWRKFLLILSLKTQKEINLHDHVENIWYINKQTFLSIFNHFWSIKGKNDISLSKVLKIDPATGQQDCHIYLHKAAKLPEEKKLLKVWKADGCDTFIY